MQLVSYCLWKALISHTLKEVYLLAQRGQSLLCKRVMTRKYPHLPVFLRGWHFEVTATGLAAILEPSERQRLYHLLRHAATPLYG